MMAGRSGRKGIHCPDEGSNIALGLQCLTHQASPTTFVNAQGTCYGALGLVQPPVNYIQKEILRYLLIFP